MLIVHIPCREWLNDTEIWKNREEGKKRAAAQLRRMNQELALGLRVEGRLPFDRFIIVKRLGHAACFCS